MKKLIFPVIIASIILTLSSCEKKVETVKLAFIGPMTGDNAAMGLGGRNSFLLAVRQRNAAGQTNHKYEVVVLDDECRPNIGIRAALKAASDPNVIAAASHYCSMVAISTADTFHKFNLPSMVWGAVLPDITYGNDYVEITRVNGTMDTQNRFAAEMMVENLGFKTFSIIHDTSDYGRGHMEYFSQAVKELGGEIISIDGVTIDQKDFTAELTKIKALGPEVIYLGGLTSLGVRIKIQMDELGIKAQFEGTSGIKNEAFNDTLGSHAEGVICFLEGAPIDELPRGEEFMEAYRNNGFEEPWEAYGPFAFVAANLIIDAVEKVGPDRKKVAVELAQNTKERDTIIGKVTFDDHGQNIVPLITLYVSQDGEWVSWKKSEYSQGLRELPGIKQMREGI
jgi:branched-chain amino acid transport system substrate-binding protein